jgi:hypothetical protein
MRLIGFKKGTTKEGKSFTILHLMDDFSENEKRYGAVGSSTTTEWVFEKLSDEVTEKLIGKDVDISYGKSASGKAYVQAVRALN